MSPNLLAPCSYIHLLVSFEAFKIDKGRPMSLLKFPIVVLVLKDAFNIESHNFVTVVLPLVPVIPIV